jgi:hypothetical protein
MNIRVSFGTSLSGYAFPNASRTARSDFDVNKRSTMNIRSPRDSSQYRPGWETAVVASGAQALQKRARRISRVRK